jgi:O-antigen/teichoic acid export membrane protein
MADEQGDRAADPEDDERWNAEVRHETPTERLDRNWTDLLQELRVVQTGVQLLTGFLLTLPFQQKFDQLSDTERAVYLVAVSLSILATGFLQAPVSVHRALFRQHRRKETVLLAHRLAIVGIFFLGCAVVAVSCLIFEVLLGWAGGLVAAALSTLLLLTLWLLLPWRVRRRDRRPATQVRTAD